MPRNTVHTSPHYKRPEGPMRDYHTDYMNEAFGDPAELTAKVKRAIGRRKIDTLVGSGLSGALVIPEVARRLGLRWAIVRKPADDSHDGKKIVGELGHNWVFLDDFVSGGSTFRRTYNAVWDATHVSTGGAWEYDDDGEWRWIKSLTVEEVWPTKFKGVIEYHFSDKLRPPDGFWHLISKSKRPKGATTEPFYVDWEYDDDGDEND